MMKCRDFYSGSTGIPNSYDNYTGQPSKGKIPTTPTSFNRFWGQYDRNGAIMPALATTDLEMIADDLVVPSEDWVSRIASPSFTAYTDGAPDIGAETPFYPNGGFSGSGYRTAITTFGIVEYYYFPYDPAHEMNSSAVVTYEFVVKSGAYSTSPIISRYCTTTPGFDFLLEFNYSGGGVYTLRAYKDFSITPIDLQIGVEPYTYYWVTLLWDGPTNTMTLKIGGGTSVQTGTGVGVYANDSISDVLIGTDAVTGNALTDGQIVDFYRHRELLSSTTILNRLYANTGTQAKTGQYPTINGRFSRAEIIVNGKIWSIGDGVLRINENGVLSEEVTSGVLLNSIDSEPVFNADWSSSVGGSSTLTRITDIYSFYQVGGHGWKVTYDSVPSIATFYQFGAAIKASSYVTITVYLRCATPGARPTLIIGNALTGRIYDVASSTWGGISYTPIGTHSTTIEKWTVTFLNEAFLSQIYLEFAGEENPANANQSYIIYYAQMVSTGYEPAPLVTRATLNTKNLDVLGYNPSQCINVNKGSCTLTLTPEYQSGFFDLTGFTNIRPACDFMFDFDADNKYYMYNSTGQNVGLPFYAFNPGVPMNFSLSWDNGGANTMSISNLTAGTTASTACTNPILASANMNVGNYGGIIASFGYVKDFKVR